MVIKDVYYRRDCEEEREGSREPSDGWNIFSDGARYLYGYKAAPTPPPAPGTPSFQCPDIGFNTRDREAAELTEPGGLQ